MTCKKGDFKLAKTCAFSGAYNEESGELLSGCATSADVSGVAVDAKAVKRLWSDDRDDEIVVGATNELAVRKVLVVATNRVVAKAVVMTNFMLVGL